MLGLGLGLWPTAGSGGGGAVEPVAPAFIETHSLGSLYSNIPANLRTGLSATTHANGGFVEELTVAVTGTSGSNILTTAETTKVAGFGNRKFDAALNRANGLDDFFVTVLGDNGSTEITLRDPLTADFVGTFCAKHDAANGQHLTAGATKAYAQHLANATVFDYARGAILAGFYHQRGANNQVADWTLNAALVSYGANNSAAPVVSSSIQNTAALNVIDPVGLDPARPSANQWRGLTFGTHLAGHGAFLQKDCAGIDVVVQGWVGAYRASTDLNGAGVAVRVRVYDGASLEYEHTQDHRVKYLQVPLPAAGVVRIEIENTDGAIYYVEANEFTIREAGVAASPSTKLITPSDKVLCMLDSWGQFYSSLFETTLATKTGATIYGRSVGGMTSEFLKEFFEARFAEYGDVTVLVTNMGVNDNSNLFGSTFTDINGQPKPLWPYDMTTTQIRDWHKENFLYIAQRCEELGIRFIQLRPGATASGSQTQALLDLSWDTDYKFVPGNGMNVQATELTLAHSFPNNVGKSTASRVRDVTNSRFMVATGSGRLATWQQEGNPGVVATPVDAVAPAFSSRTTRNQPENAVMSYVVETSNEDATITITGGADIAHFSIGQSEPRRATLTMAAKNFEVPTDADANNTYVVQLTATDPSANATNQTVTVTVTNVAD